MSVTCFSASPDTREHALTSGLESGSHKFGTFSFYKYKLHKSYFSSTPSSVPAVATLDNAKGD